MTADEHVSNICVSTNCNSVNVNNVKSSVASSTFAVKPVTNSVKFNDIVNAPNVAEPLCSDIYSSNKSKNEPVYSNLKESFSSEFKGPYRSDSVFAQSAPRAVPCADLPYLGTQHYPRPNIYPPGFAPHNYPTYDELFLPPPEFKRFNGNPLAYRAFISNFETHVEPRLNDQRMLFCLLLQHCESNVRDKIEHFSGRGSMAYTLAKERPYQEYGRPCIIADICEQTLLQAPQVKANNPAALKSYSELLERMHGTLANVCEMGSLNSLDSMTKLVNKLPFDMRRRWVRESVMVEEHSGHVAKFSHLVKFVNRECQELNSLFGRRIFSVNSDSTNSNKPTRSTKALYNFSVDTNTEESAKGFVVGLCWYCDDTSHVIHDCPKFKELTFKERSKFVRTSRMCYKCFSKKHKTNDCKRTNMCKVKDSKGTFHHTLLHNYHSPRGISQASDNYKPLGNTIQLKDGESDSGTGGT